MYQTGDTREADGTTVMPSGFKYVIGASAFFIAGCSAFFSVKGLGLLFIGSATAVMIMASSLEVGKLVAASFLYRYWNQISRPMKIYLTLAVLLLIGITSLGNYGYLARAYERTHTRVALHEQQIAALEKEIADTQRQIDSSRGQLGKATDVGREDITKLQQRIAQSGDALEQSLTRLQQRRQTAQDRRDRDIQVHTQSLADQTEVMKKAIASEDTAIADLNERLAVLDRGVDAYTKLGGPGIFKQDGVKKGQELREKQAPERDAITAQIADRHKQQEQLRADHAKIVAATDREVATVRDQFAQESARFDTEESELRKGRDESVADTEKQLAALQTQGQTITTGGDTQIESLYVRIRARNEEIRHLREQIAATDIGSYRFVARAFEAPADDIVKWLTLALVLVFDPLAVSLAVGFNVAMVRDRRPRPSMLATPLASPVAASEISTPSAPVLAGRARGVVMGTSLLIAAVGVGAIAVAAHWGVSVWRHQTQASHSGFIPADSFAVMTLHPVELKRAAQNGESVPNWLGVVAGKGLSESLTQLLSNGFDPQADVYAFAKFPTGRSEKKSDRPVLLCGLVARVTDAAAAEVALSRLADQFSGGGRTSATSTTSLSRNRAMIRHGRGQYMDPEGGFFTYGIADGAAIVMLEFEGDPKTPCVEKEMQVCLARPDSEAVASTDTSEQLSARALSRDGALALWLDAGRFFNNIPKNPAAQARFQQLQQHVGFDLLVKILPTADGQLNVIADYAYQSDRFKDRQQPTALQILTQLGSAESAGIAGRLMDRCADTLDYDSLIERLRSALGGAERKGVEEVRVEKTFASERDARFVLTARCNAEAGAPLVTAFNTFWR